MLDEKARAAAIKAVGAIRCKMTGATLAFVPSDALYADTALRAYHDALSATRQGNLTNLADATPKNPLSEGRERS